MLKWLRRLGAGGRGAAIAVLVVLRVGFGLHVYMDGDFRPHLAFGKPSAHYDALEAQRAAQRRRASRGARRPGAAAAPAAAPGSPPATARTAGRSRRPRSAPTSQPGAATGRRRHRLPSPRPGPTIAAPARDGVYRQRAIAATWPAGGPRLLWKQPVGEGHASFVDRARRRLHHRAAARPRSGRRLRRRHRPRTLDQRLGRVLLGIDGRRRPARDADLRRRHPLRPRRGRRAARAARPTPAPSSGAPTSSRDAGAENLQWGMSASPLIVDGKVIVQPGGRGALGGRLRRGDRPGRCGRRSTTSRPTSRRCW